MANVAVICLCPVSFLTAAWGSCQPRATRWSSLKSASLFFAASAVLFQEGVLVTLSHPSAEQGSVPSTRVCPDGSTLPASFVSWSCTRIFDSSNVF